MSTSWTVNLGFGWQSCLRKNTRQLLFKLPSPCLEREGKYVQCIHIQIDIDVYIDTDAVSVLFLALSIPTKDDYLSAVIGSVQRETGLEPETLAFLLWELLV